MESPPCPSCPVADRCPLRTTRAPDRIDHAEGEVRVLSCRKKDSDELTQILAMHVVIVRRGALKITNTAGDILQVIAAGDSYGFESHLADSPHATLAKALMLELELCAIDRHAYERLVAERPVLLRQIMKDMASATLNARIGFHWAKRSLRERAILILDQLRSRFGVRYGQFKMIDVPLTKIDLASLMCTVQESAVRVLSEFREDGLISQNGKRLIILDNDRLDKLVAEIQRGQEEVRNEQSQTPTGPTRPR